MPLPEPAAREAFYTRSIIVRGYRRSDGLFDVEGNLRDVRLHDVPLMSGVRKAGEPIHDMWLRLTVDTSFTIVDATAVTDGAPFAQVCGSIAPAYKGLIGKQVGRGFRNTVRTLVGGVNGCTHLSELLLAMGTCVIQALYDSAPKQQDAKPFSLDGCHALDTAGPVVAEFYPRWYRATDKETTS